MNDYGLQKNLRRREYFSFFCLTVCFLSMALIHIRFLYAPLFSDDAYIFENPIVKQGKSIFTFWKPGDFESKNWPLFYSMGWLLYRIFGTNFFLYHLLEVAVHATNGVLIFLISRNLKFRFPALPTLLFWAHPLTVEPVSWIFQFGKLVSCSLLLLAVLYSLDTPRSLIRRPIALLFLFSSLWTSSYSHLVALASTISIGTSKERAAHRVLIGILLFLVGYAFLLAFCSGAVTQNNERQSSTYQNLLFDRPSNYFGPIQLDTDAGLTAESLSAAGKYLNQAAVSPGN